jgi:uracil-DNA glycosylase
VLEVAVGHLVESGAEAVLTGREMVDTMSGGIMESRPVEGVYGQLTTLALTEHRPALWKMVPPRLSDNPQALVVTGNPNRVEAIRGLPLVGPDGATFRKSYLERLGVGVGDVSIAHACPAVGETTEAWAEWLDRLVDRHAGVPVIALGKQASVALGDRDHTTLPHPRAVRLRGDRGEVSRKAKAIQKTMAAINHLRSQTWHCPILKSDDDRRMVYGVVLEPGTVDLQGDVLALDTIESAAHKYLIQHRTVGDSHSQLAGAEVVESYLAPADLELGGQIISQGSWVMGVHVTDDHLWLAVKAGEYTGFSIGGTGERKEITVD